MPEPLLSLLLFRCTFLPLSDDAIRPPPALSPLKGLLPLPLSGRSGGDGAAMGLPDGRDSDSESDEDEPEDLSSITVKKELLRAELTLESLEICLKRGRCGLRSIRDSASQVVLVFRERGAAAAVITQANKVRFPTSRSSPPDFSTATLCQTLVHQVT